MFSNVPLCEVISGELLALLSVLVDNRLLFLAVSRGRPVTFEPKAIWEPSWVFECRQAFALTGVSRESSERDKQELIMHVL